MGKGNSFITLRNLQQNQVKGGTAICSDQLGAACQLEGFKSFYLRLFNLKIKIITIKVKLQLHMRQTYWSHTFRENQVLLHTAPSLD